MMREQLTHKERVRLLAEGTREKMCRVMGITQEQYDMLHYELAHEWLKHNHYVELTARVFILSGSFHRWFRQQAMFAEMNMLHYIGRSQQDLPEIHRDAILNMPMKPSNELRMQITSEGFEAMRRDNELRKIKIYG